MNKNNKYLLSIGLLLTGILVGVASSIIFLKRIAPSQSLNEQASLCGVVNYNPISSEFNHRCGLSDIERDMIIDLSSIKLKEHQLCRIYYGGNGQPDDIYCKNLPSSYDDVVFRLNGKWECTASNSYSSYNDRKIYIHFEENGTYTARLKKKNEDIEPPIIYGTYKPIKNAGFSLRPELLDGNPISKSGLPRRDFEKIRMANYADYIFQGFSGGVFYASSKTSSRLHCLKSKPKIQ